ncbi:gene transfer agent family protein [Methylobrevis pamukkalensis]|uniref:Gene transfer agent family protein n=1 Tax=Methylobrevis pamukkalensis TaxID=1439726 RepID=A0A1E3GXU2_9HYPH|nr:gene transfer agent family protein [Methylobrevis pamukkalensis]ODN68853.1 hypothetical protein A6302_03858 [Methylobrevis pamukkalensis]
MHDAPAHIAFLGDAERTFALPVPMIVALEKATGHGIGTLAARLFQGVFSWADLVETIRLGLIGGGTDPKDAAGIIDAWVNNRPIAETLPLTVAVLETCYFGAPQEVASDGA